MKIDLHNNKTIITPDKGDSFIFVADMAIHLAKSHGVSTVFTFEGRRFEVHGHEKPTQVYAEYLKRCKEKPTTVSGSLEDIKCNPK